MNYYVMSNYNLRGDVDLHYWWEIRTWNLLVKGADKGQSELDCGVVST